MARYLTLVIGLCLLSLASVVLLSPSPEEKLERALSRLSPTAALAELNRMYAAGDRTPNLLLRRVELLLANGEINEARRTLESLTESPENASLGSDSLAQLELEFGDVAAATSHLQRAYSLAPTPKRLDQLARLLELSRKTGEELALLAAADPRMLQDRSADRLLELLVARGDMDGAERLLRARAETEGEARSVMRGALCELLAGSDRADEVAVLAARWLAQDGDTAALALAVERLIERGFLHHARVLAQVAVTSGPPGAHVVIPVFAIAGHGIEARSLLRDWLAVHPRPGPEDSAALLQYAQTMNDFTAPRALLRRGPDTQFAPEFVVGVLKGTYFRFGAAALPEFRRYMTPDVLGTDPLFAAELALVQRHPSDATHYLELAAAKDLEPWESDAWAALARQITAGPLRDRLIRARTKPPAP